MLFSADMRELIGLFEAHSVEYVLVGGFAVNYYGYSRTTQDIDFLVRPSPAAAKIMMRVLEAFGFGEAGIPSSAFESVGTAIHLGAAPNRIDLLTSLKGIDNESIFSAATKVEIGGIEIPIITFEHLIQAKRSSSRLRDLADVEELTRIREL